MVRDEKPGLLGNRLEIEAETGGTFFRFVGEIEFINTDQPDS